MAPPMAIPDPRNGSIASPWMCPNLFQPHPTLFHQFEAPGPPYGHKMAILSADIICSSSNSSSDISSSSSRLDKQQFLPSQSSVSRCKVGSASTRSCRRCLNPALPSTATFAHITIMFYKMPQTIQPWQQYCVRSRSIQLCLRQNCRD